MRHETDTETDPAVATTPATRARRLVSNLASYALFGLALAAFYAFFAPHLGTPPIGLAEALPTVVAPTEGQEVVDVMPAIVGAVAAGVSVYLR